MSRAGRIAGIALATLAALAAGALVGAATRRSDSVSLVPPELTATMPRSVFLAIATGTLALLLVLAVLVLTYMRPDDEMPSGAPLRKERHPLFIILAVTLPAVLVIGGIVLLRNLSGGMAPAPPTGPGGGGPPSTSEQPVGLDDIVLPVVAFAAVLLVSSAVARRYVARRPTRLAEMAGAPEGRPLDEESAVAQVLDGGLDALISVSDPRRAVIAAYARMERAMADRGWARRPSEGPTEYVARVLSLVPEHGDDVGELTRVYVFARFSDREITPGMRDQAIAAVRRLRARSEGAADA